MGDRARVTLGGFNGLGKAKIHCRRHRPPWQRQSLFLPTGPAQNPHPCLAGLAGVLGGLCRRHIDRGLQLLWQDWKIERHRAAVAVFELGEM